MSRKKKPRMEYRYYEVPEKCPVLVLQGEKWLQNYGYQIDYLHFAGALMLGQGVRPYLGAGIGISRFSAYESETRPSLALALGIQPQLNDSVALRAEIRGYGTFLNDNSTFLCNEERCNMHIKGELLGQAQANLGITARF